MSVKSESAQRCVEVTLLRSAIPAVALWLMLANVAPGQIEVRSHTPTAGSQDEALDCEVRPGTPVPDTLPLPGNPVNQKVRYVSFTTPDAGRSLAFRVTFVEMPPPYADWEGVQMWVAEQILYCEGAGQGIPPDALGCGSAPGQPRHWLTSTLQCEPFFMDWSLQWKCPYWPQNKEPCLTDADCDGECRKTIHISHEGIIPGATYAVQAIDSTCVLAESSFSEPLLITTSRWGDVVSDCTTTPCGPPDGSIDVTTDVTAILDKFKNARGAAVKTRTDIEPATPDQKINISDVTYALDGFRGRSYPPNSFPAPSPPPCQ